MMNKNSRIKKLKFNLSPSAIGLYNKSQLQFYFRYIEKIKPDTKVIECYGLAGTIVHECLEDYTNLKNKDEVLNKFEVQWFSKGLTQLLDFKNKTLDKNIYLEALEYGMKLIDENKFIPIKAEEIIQFPLVDNERALIKIKGIIDLQAKNDKNEYCVVDWKTSNSKNDFKIQATHYAYSIWRKKNVIPKVYFVYLKLKNIVEYNIDLDDIKKYEIYLKKLAKEIINKGFDISKYEIGDINDMFNSYKVHCNLEIQRREALKKENVIYYDINKNNIIFKNYPNILQSITDKKFSYFIEGAVFSELYKRHIWDGKVHLFNKNKISIGLFKMLKDFIEEYNTFFGTNYTFKLENDFRNEKIRNKKFDLVFKENNFKLRDYQLEAIEIALKEKIGILYIGTGGGKTLIASEIIRRINKRTLYIINRIELIDQTVEMFEELLGVKIGKMSEGELNIYNQVTIASIQTINSILKDKKNKDRRNDLLKYLYNLNLVIYDECQTVKDDGMYKMLAKNIVNADYFFGLTGSPFRNDEHTLKMKALVGDVIYSKTTKELEEEGYLVPTKVYFLNFELENDYNGYQDSYSNLIVENKDRNKKILEIINKFKDKKILVITKQINHGKNLEKLIPNSFLITSQTDKKIRKQKFSDFKNNKFNILIGSSQIFSTGVNIPNLDVIINTSAHKSDVQSVQTIGRVKRKIPGKTKGYYIDFNDKGSQYFENSAKQRMKILEEYGHEIQKINKIEEIK